MKKGKATVDLTAITLATALIAASVYFFIIPSAIPLGSISGLALILSNLLPLSISAITMVLNVGLLILGFLLLGREFGAKTVYTSILLPAVMGLLERFFPNQGSIMGDPLTDLCCFIFFCSVGQTILFNRNASSGGLDIVTKILNKYLHMDMGKAASAAGLCVAVSSAFFYDVRTVLLAVVGTYMSGVALDHFIFGMNEKKRVCIISREETALLRYILRDLDAGATVYEAHGAYDDRTRREIITILDKDKYKKLINHIARLDPTAFVTVLPIHEVYTPPHDAAAHTSRAASVEK